MDPLFIHRYPRNDPLNCSAAGATS